MKVTFSGASAIELVTLPASAAFSPRSSSAVGRSWRARVRSSCIAWLASAFVSSISRSSSGGACSRTASSRRSRPVSDWFTSSWRSRAIAGALLLLGGQRGARSAAALGLKAFEHATEGLVEALDLLGLANAYRLAEVGPGPGEVRTLHLIDEALERPKPALEEEHVDQDREGNRQTQDEPRFGLCRELDARGWSRSSLPRRRR